MIFKMKGSPLLKDVKMYNGNGESVTVDDANLGEAYRDENGNKARDYTYTTKDGKEATDVFYLSKPRFEKEREPLNPPQQPNYT